MIKSMLKNLSQKSSVTNTVILDSIGWEFKPEEIKEGIATNVYQVAVGPSRLLKTGVMIGVSYSKKEQVCTSLWLLPFFHPQVSSPRKTLGPPNNSIITSSFLIPS